VTEVLNASPATSGLRLAQKEFDDYVKRYRASQKDDANSENNGSSN
jgi:hypothetical protein